MLKCMKDGCLETDDGNIKGNAFIRMETVSLEYDRKHAFHHSDFAWKGMEKT